MRGGDQRRFIVFPVVLAAMLALPGGFRAAAAAASGGAAATTQSADDSSGIPRFARSFQRRGQAPSARPRSADTGQSSCQSSWTQTPVAQGTSDNLLNSVVALSNGKFWAVGAQTTTFNGAVIDQPLAETWDGLAWYTVPTPTPWTTTNNDLLAISAVSNTDLWAVGTYDTAPTGGIRQPSTLHYDGSAWKTIGDPAPLNAQAENFAVAAVASQDVWTVGYWRNGTTNQTWIQHWNGSAWSPVPSPNVAGSGNNDLISVAAISPANLWAVGFYRPFNGVGSYRQTLIEHWNGSAWSIVPSPNAGTATGNILYSVSGSGPNDIWAAGVWQNGQADNTLIEHWDGVSWRIVSSPNPGAANSDLFAIAATGPNDAWAVGNQSNSFPAPGTTPIVLSLAEHWNGSSWQPASTPSPGVTVSEFNDVVARSSSSVWAVGDFDAPGATTTTLQSFLAFFCSPPTVTSIAPATGPTGTTVTVRGSGFVWAGGVNFGTVAANTISFVSDAVLTASAPVCCGPSGSNVDVTVTYYIAMTRFGGTSATSSVDRFSYIFAPAAPTGVSALAGDGEATVTWTPPSATGGAPVASYTVTASPGGAHVVVTPLAPSATITGLTNGTPYSFTVTATNAGGTSPPSPVSNTVTPTSVAQGNPVAALPAMSNLAYGGYLTVAYLENYNPVAAHIRVQYFDQSGHPVGKGNSAASLPFWGTWTLRQDNADGLATGQAGSAVIYSDQPLAVFVNEFAPNGVGDATSYTAIKLPAGAGSTLYAPAIANGAYGGYTTGIGLVNAGPVPTDVRITYRDGSGTVVKVQTLIGISANAYQGLYSGDAALALPAQFAGTATIESTSTPPQPLAVVINEVGPGGQFSSYDAVPSGALSLDAPVALNNAFGGYYTGMGIQNTAASPGAVTINYFDGAGNLVKTVSNQSIAASGYLGIYQGDATLGPPASGSGYSAVVTASVPIAMIVNEVAPATSPARQSTSYNTFAAGSATVNLPLVESAGADGWSTGLGILNTSSAATTATVTYFDAATGQVLGTVVSPSLAPNAFWGAYQPTSNLPNGQRASALVTTSGGTVAVICNESNATAFMSYDGQ